MAGENRLLILLAVLGFILILTIIYLASENHPQPLGLINATVKTNTSMIFHYDNFIINPFQFNCTTQSGYKCGYAAIQYGWGNVTFSTFYNRTIPTQGCTYAISEKFYVNTPAIFLYQINTSMLALDYKIVNVTERPALNIEGASYYLYDFRLANYSNVSESRINNVSGVRAFGIVISNNFFFTVAPGPPGIIQPNYLPCGFPS